MPVEIKEVVIRAVLNGDDEENKDSSKSIIQECVTEVLKILKKQTRR